MTCLLNVLVGLVLFIGLDALTTTMTTQLHKRCCPTFLKATSSSDLVPSTPPKVTPKVSAPEGWSPPTPKPLSTSKTQIPSLLTGSLSLALRLGSAVTVAGWSPKVGLSDPNVDEYSLKLGPLFLSDQSSLSPSVERGIKTPLILYEYEPSPFCKKVREILCFLDIPCEFRPCPRQKGFSDELFERTGRRTVPYLTKILITACLRAKTSSTTFSPATAREQNRTSPSEEILPPLLPGFPQLQEG